MNREAKFRIKKVNPENKVHLQTLKALHHLAFFDSAPHPEYTKGHWWIIYQGQDPVGFGGLRQSNSDADLVYFERSGVLPSARGHKLQKRLIKVREAWAKKFGYLGAVTDTLDNPFSANNLIASGFTTFTPKYRWGHSEAVYWKKMF